MRPELGGIILLNSLRGGRTMTGRRAGGPARHKSPLPRPCHNYTAAVRRLKPKTRRRRRRCLDMSPAAAAATIWEHNGKLYAIESGRQEVARRRDGRQHAKLSIGRQNQALRSAATRGGGGNASSFSSLSLPLPVSPLRAQSPSRRRTSIFIALLRVFAQNTNPFEAPLERASERAAEQVRDLLLY